MRTWRVRKAWIGVIRRVRDERGLFKDDVLLGVIRRSGRVRQIGHFCTVGVSVNGKKYEASGAEDRIYPFHSIKLEGDDEAPALEFEAVGWCNDGSTYAFKTPDGKLVELVGAGSTVPISNALKEIPEELWKEEWKHERST